MGRKPPMESKEKMFIPVEDAMMAPVFELADTRGQRVCLEDFRGKAPVVLVLARGFA